MVDGSSPKSDPQIDTGGGAAIGGSVHIDHGDFVGRDKIVNQVIHHHYTTPPPPAEETPAASPPKPFEPAMLPIPGGEFLMGDGEPAQQYTVSASV